MNKLTSLNLSSAPISWSERGPHLIEYVHEITDALNLIHLCFIGFLYLLNPKCLIFSLISLRVIENKCETISLKSACPTNSMKVGGIVWLIVTVFFNYRDIKVDYYVNFGDINPSRNQISAN